MPQNPSIHGLRGLAILMVFGLHVYGMAVSGGFASPFPDGSIALQLIEWGHRGVDLFFMISGYLIVAGLARHRNALHFLLQRVIRIYPAFLLPHTLIFVVSPMIGFRWVAELGAFEYAAHFLSNLLFLPGCFDLPIANPVAWTLSLEFAFYLLAAAAFALRAHRLGRPATIALWAGWLGATGTGLYYHPRAWFFVAGAAAFW
jgi:peptidoglycan/LPS O-acetylase OafA/YrhL